MPTASENQAGLQAYTWLLFGKAPTLTLYPTATHSIKLTSHSCGESRRKRPTSKAVCILHCWDGPQASPSLGSQGTALGFDSLLSRSSGNTHSAHSQSAVCASSSAKRRLRDKGDCRSVIHSLYHALSGKVTLAGTAARQQAVSENLGLH